MVNQLISLREFANDIGYDEGYLHNMLRKHDDSPRFVNKISNMHYYDNSALVDFFRKHGITSRKIDSKLAADFCRNIGRGVRYG